MQNRTEQDITEQNRTEHFIVYNSLSNLHQYAGGLKETLLGFYSCKSSQVLINKVLSIHNQVWHGILRIN